jgi:hypothetical protein
MYRQSSMASDHFYLFAALASFSSEIQARLRHVESPEAIIAIAAEQGFQITRQQLAHYSAHLNDEHWVWVQKGEAWRKNFFGRELQLDLQSV